MACEPLILGIVGAGARPRPMPRVVLFDVMDTLVVDPFFTGMHSSVFGCESLQELFAVKDPQTFLDFEHGRITEVECHARYFLDRRPVDGDAVRAHLVSNYKYVEGMKDLCEELKKRGVIMALCSNYPAPWAALLEDTMGLRQFAEWVSVSGRTGHRKPAPQAYTTALTVLGCEPADVVFVDDSHGNCVAARELGIDSIRFESALQLRGELRARFGYPESEAS
ncbi:HAD-like domain-containing protein [Pavlovales sp. CCMP2436]|nr:HAD-like domain-containing protein [Pavlovales sp. CCMP2436]